MDLHFKFAEKSRPGDRERLLAQLVDQGASNVRPLFEGETDPELASVYVVECGDEVTEEQLLRMLESSGDVEFVERELRRKLIR